MAVLSCMIVAGVVAPGLGYDMPKEEYYYYMVKNGGEITTKRNRKSTTYFVPSNTVIKSKIDINELDGNCLSEQLQNFGLLFKKKSWFFKTSWKVKRYEKESAALSVRLDNIVQVGCAHCFSLQRKVFDYAVCVEKETARVSLCCTCRKEMKEFKEAYGLTDDDLQELLVHGDLPEEVQRVLEAQKIVERYFQDHSATSWKEFWNSIESTDQELVIMEQWKMLYETGKELKRVGKL